ncbi:hypothetical protein DYBT9275_02104 [Dyadobacter sp. CECT 9275]|uniref:Endonuclease/exonuclease/phosphatase domain-containing protein n=1 Tax=Dyadobacter helix TaxID=2822344 RepID=A0A916NL42_9BACT|nr:endonuclease/exonuclease/phosphatase family protein [Dyadobacter sp. CECT 9275]CAG4998901.1 hypothetical protein DYBT9275_02104 [Dyadobacter sp. CECT 9275]
MNSVKIILEIIGACMIIFTLVPLIRHDYWIFRVFEYPRLQKLFVTLVILILFICLFPVFSGFGLLFISLLTANALYLFYQIYPFTFIAKKVLLNARENRPHSRVKILSANVFQDNRNTTGCLAVIKKYDPDIVLLLETDQFWYEETSSLQNDYAFQVTVPLENTYGMLLYSKLELTDTSVHYLVDKEIPSIEATVHLKSGEKISLHCVHPTPPVPGENLYSTERDKELLIVAKKVKEYKKPVVVVGDLNDVAWSYTTELFVKISGLLDPRIGRGFYNTFHAKYPFLRFPLDHVFCSTDFKLVRLERLPNFSSDHYPILIELQYEPQAELEQDEPVADSDEKQLAEEKINKPT